MPRLLQIEMVTMLQVIVCRALGVGDVVAQCWTKVAWDQRRLLQAKALEQLQLLTPPSTPTMVPPNPPITSAEPQQVPTLPAAGWLHLHLVFCRTTGGSMLVVAKWRPHHGRKEGHHTMPGLQSLPYQTPPNLHHDIHHAINMYNSIKCCQVPTLCHWMLHQTSSQSHLLYTLNTLLVTQLIPLVHID